MAGTLNIQLLSQPNVGDKIIIQARYLNNSGTYNLVELPIYFSNMRILERRSTIGASLNSTAMNLLTAITLDYRDVGGLGNLEVEMAGIDSLKLTLNNTNWEFVGMNGDLDFLSFTVENVVAETPRTAKFIGYDVAASSCDTLIALYEVTGGTGVYNYYIHAGAQARDLPSPVPVPVGRGESRMISFTDSNDTFVATRLLKIPRKLIPADISIYINYAESGASINVQPQFISEYLNPLTYSMDGVNFSELNVFTGQPEGTYTIYVKDAFGCVVSKQVVVDGYSTVTELILDISDINPIRYALVDNGKKNRYNTLSHEQLKNISYPFIQSFTVEDKPITQIKTNAKNLNVFALECDGTKHPLNPVQRSNHLGQTLKTTGVQFSTESGRLGIYFGVVDILDPLTNTVIEAKDFGYQVPVAFNNIGRLIYIEGVGTIPVESIIYDDAYEAFVLVFGVNYTGAEVDVTVEATYNIQNYEIYEFVTDMSTLPESFMVVVEAGMTAVERIYISEPIERVEDSKDLIEIIYWNTEALGGMNYGTGVAHTLRLYHVLSRLSDQQTVVGYNGDVERYNTNHEVFDGEEFIFSYLSEEMVRKLRLILAHDRLFINGVLYRLNETPELNSRFTTNICELSAVLSTGGDNVENFDLEIIEPQSGTGVDNATYDLEQAIAAAKGKALILWKK